MNRLGITILSFILLIIGFSMIVCSPDNSFAISLGMLLIAISILSIAILIYFPPTERHVRLRVIAPKIPPKVLTTKRKPIRRKKPKKRRAR
jgi:hypothetical protein